MTWPRPVETFAVAGVQRVSGPYGIASARRLPTGVETPRTAGGVFDHARDPGGRSLGTGLCRRRVVERAVGDFCSSRATDSLGGLQAHDATPWYLYIEESFTFG